MFPIENGISVLVENKTKLENMYSVFLLACTYHCG